MQTRYELVSFSNTTPKWVVGFHGPEAISFAREVAKDTEYQFTKLELREDDSVFMRWTRRPNWVVEEICNGDGDTISTRLI